MLPSRHSVPSSACKNPESAHRQQGRHQLSSPRRPQGPTVRLEAQMPAPHASLSSVSPRSSPPNSLLSCQLPRGPPRGLSPRRASGRPAQGTPTTARPAAGAVQRPTHLELLSPLPRRVQIQTHIRVPFLALLFSR